MFLNPLSKKILDQEIVKADKKKCRRFGPCGVGEHALFLNSFYIERMYYVPFSAVTRVFKRVAMSKGGFTGKGIFATMPYLVVLYDNGMEKQCNFKREEEVDAILEYIAKIHPEIPRLSEAVEKKRAEQAALEAKKRRETILTETAKKEIKKLQNARTYLEKKPSVGQTLSRSAKAKRINECANPAYRWAALAIVLLGIAAAVYGIYALITKAGFGIYFTLFGFAAVFLFAGARVLPTGKNNKQLIENQWLQACREAEEYIGTYEGDFFVPACYAHPVTITRMIRAIYDKKAETAAEALEVVKKDLQALNANVTVEQEEYEEVTTIKPMFLVQNYK